MEFRLLVLCITVVWILCSGVTGLSHWLDWLFLPRWLVWIGLAMATSWLMGKD